MCDSVADNRGEMQALAAEAAETLDGVSLIMVELAARPDVSRSIQMQLQALRDAVGACRDRMDRIADLLD